MSGGTLCLVALSAAFAAVAGGQCWSRATRAGRCTESLRGNATRQECCADGAAATAWSPADLRPGQLFYWRTLGGGVPCEPCKTSCEGVRCGRGLRCAVRGGRPACACAPRCPRKQRRLGEVCGTDGRTYRHPCRLARRQCGKDRHLTPDYFGKCQRSCASVRCAGRKRCLLDQALRPHCVRCQERRCPDAAPAAAVCGADNATYASDCHLRRAACLRGRAVPIAYRGPCTGDATCATVRCGERRRCLRGGAAPRCATCPRRCGREETGPPVCASNGHTYASWCQLMRDACRHGQLLEVRQDGRTCRESSQNNVISVNVFEELP